VARRDDVVEGVGPDDEDTLVADERAALLLVRLRELQHRLEHLDLRVRVDVDVLVRLRDLAQRGVHGRRADLDGDDGVERRHGGLERLERDVLVREHTELAVADAERNTARDVRLVGAEPSVTGGVLWSGVSSPFPYLSDKWVAKPTLKMWWRKAS
jgi:hypothetical protein